MDKINPRLLKKYVEGNCSENESELVEQWLEREDNLFEKAEDTSAPELDLAYEQTMWDTFLEKADIQMQKLKLWWWGLRIGSACITLASLAFLYVHFNPTTETMEWLTLEVQKGKTASILLADSSEVWLSGGSKLIYPKKFGKEVREITLEYGQAFFDVRKMKEKPFIVHTDSVQINVLGTRFDIDNSKLSNDVIVALQSGSIAFKQSAESTYKLKPGEILRYNKLSSKITSIEHIAEIEIGNWKAGILQFRNTKLAEAFQKLEAQYGVNFIVEDKQVSRQPITGKFEKLPLKDVLFLLQQSTDLQFRQHKDTIYVRK